MIAAMLLPSLTPILWFYHHAVGRLRLTVLIGVGAGAVLIARAAGLG